MPQKNYYDILEVPLNATQEAIQESYRLLASMIHPDRYTQGSKQWLKANEKLKELNNAYDTLKDPQKRAAYDAQFRTSCQTTGGSTTTQGSQTRQPRQENRDSSPSDASSSHSTQESVSPVNGATMVYIPAGEFLRGSDNNSSAERPSRRIYLDAYWIYKYPVTVLQYRAFCWVNNRSMPEAPAWGWIDDHPMVNVTWEAAVAYAEWVGGRLPTEAQWEKAARGTDGREYPWGNVWDVSKCHCSKREWGDAGRTARVGSYRLGVSPYGAHDMAGNVWEWCSDWYADDYYGRSPSDNPENTQKSTSRYRVLRGGSWYDDNPNGFRCAYRDDFYPYYGDYVRGFRVARQA